MSPFKAGRIINSYQDALEHYTMIEPYRKGTKFENYCHGLSAQEISTIRPASSEPSQRRRKHQVCYLKPLEGNEKAVVFRMYDTDVITYYPDNTIRIIPYQSMTTNAFANALLPRKVRAALTQRHQTITVYDRWSDAARTYLLQSDEFRLKLSHDNFVWAPEKTTPIHDCRLHTSKYFKALKKYNYNMFETWVKARMALTNEKQGALHGKPTSGEAFDLATFKCFLLGSEHWNEAYLRHGKACLEEVKKGIIYLSDCLERKQLDYVEGTDLRAHMRRQEKYFLIERTQRRRPKGYYLACVYGHDPECACFLGEKPYIPSDQKEDL